MFDSFVNLSSWNCCYGYTRCVASARWGRPSCDELKWKHRETLEVSSIIHIQLSPAGE